MRLFFLFISIIFILPVTACVQVKKAEYRPAPDHPADAHPAPLGFRGVKLELPTGAEIGAVGVDGGIFSLCAWPYESAGRSLIRAAIDSKDIKDIFHDALEAQGYDITGSLDFEFGDDFEIEELRSEYVAGAIIREIDMVACYQQPNSFLWLFGRRQGYEGELYIAVDWVLFDSLRRSTVYKTRTEGYAKRRRPNEEGLTLMINDAFEMAAHNFGADEAFHDLLFNGVKPPDGWRKKEAYEDRPRKYDTREDVVIDNPPLLTAPLVRHADQSRRAAVLVQAGAGHGSGFFITKQGHILTNAHVVGNALRVRIVTSDKEDKLVAEVLRKDNARDVALLKLEEIPDDLAITTLPVRTDWPVVGETVHVIGAPRMTRMQDTVMAGIVSAHRRDFKFLGSRQNLIQADVVTHGGNSGGPLLDVYGNVVGIVHGGFNVAIEADSGMNMFIPIGEALKIMDIELGGVASGGRPD